MAGTGVPRQAVPFRGGVQLASRNAHGDDWIEWFDATGRRLESARGRGGRLVTSGRGAVMEVAILASERLRLAARSGPSPSRLRGWRVVAELPADGRVFGSFGAAMRRSGEAIVGWSTYPLAGCGVWVRAVAADARPGTEPVCAAPPVVDSAELGTSGSGRIWLAWSLLEPEVTPLRRAIFVRELEIE